MIGLAQMISYVIRPYSPKDAEDYAGTLLRTWPCESIQEARKNVAVAVRKCTEAKQKEEIWVAEIEGRAVGFILLEFTRIWGDKGEAFDQKAVGIDWFDINPDFQRKGIGKQLLLKTEEKGRLLGLNILFMRTNVRNLAMVNFASKNGFKFERYIKEFWGKGTEDAFLLTKRI